MISKNIFVLMLMSLVRTIAFADAGRAGAQFLNLGNGARAAGMGESQTGLAEGVNAIYWNPAGLGLTSCSELTITHNQFFEKVSEQYAALALPLEKGKYGALGFSYTQLGIRDIETRDATSALIGSTDEKDSSVQISYGFRVTRDPNGSEREGLYLGVGLKQISESLAGASARTVGTDVGLQYRPGSIVASRVGEWTRRLSFGVSSLNIGKGLTFDQDEAPLPHATRVGVGYSHFLWGDALNANIDLIKSRNNTSHTAAGFEFWLKNMLALRLGFIDGQDIGSGLRAGTGFRFQNVQFDYAWAGYGSQLGNTHRFTFGLRFGDGATGANDGLKIDLVKFHLSAAQDALSSGSYHEAVLEANHVLEIDPRNGTALQILIQAGEKLKPVDSLPTPAPEKNTNEAH